MLNRFIQVVSGQEKYNRPGLPIDAIPIVVYHRIDNSRAPYSTTVSLFIEEMKYLYNNGFTYHYQMIGTLWITLLRLGLLFLKMDLLMNI
jgi:hypothetical protein